MDQKTARSVYKGGLVLLIGFIFIKIGGILFRILCMRELSVQAYGEVAIFIVLSNWVLLFATLNVTLGLTRFVSKNPAKRKDYLSSVLLGALLLSIAVSGLLAALAPFIASHLNVGAGVIYWTAICTPFAAIYNVGIFYLRGGYRMAESTKADAIVMVARIAVLAALLYAGIQEAPYLAFLASFVAIDIFFAARKARSGAPFSGAKIKEAARGFPPILMYSIPVFAGEILRQFAMGLDRISLSSFYSPAAAGIYDAATALCLGYIIIATSYANALLPAAAANGRKKERRQTLLKSLKATVVLFFGFTVALVLFGDYVLYAINPAYAASAGLIIPIALAYAICGILTILSFYSISIGEQRYTIYSGAVFAFLSVILNLYLVPQMSYLGAAEALIISSAAATVVQGVLIWKKEKS